MLASLTSSENSTLDCAYAVCAWPPPLPTGNVLSSMHSLSSTPLKSRSPVCSRLTDSIPTLSNAGPLVATVVVGGGAWGIGAACVFVFITTVSIPCYQQCNGGPA